MRIYGVLVLVLAIALGAWAAKDETAEQVAARAASSTLDMQSGLFLKAAQLRFKAAESQFDAGKVDEATQAVKETVGYCEKAAGAAGNSGKKLKKTEIELRRMVVRLRDIRRTLNFEDQAPLETAADRLETLRTDLLQRMFSKEKKP